jgi:hypothetical protein
MALIVSFLYFGGYAAMFLCRDWVFRLEPRLQYLTQPPYR